MGTAGLGVLLWTTLGIAMGHTLVGLDHSLPFVLLGRAQGWRTSRTLFITALCGLGHVTGSVLLGLAGIGLGASAERLMGLELARGNLAAWLLIGFGLAYAVWGLWRGRRRRHLHGHPGHAHGPADPHGHDHQHGHPHLHVGRGTTFLALFVVFALGPCEALIPLMMAPAAAASALGVAAVVGVFTLGTVTTMVGIVALGLAGLRPQVFERLERHMDPVAGMAIAASGLAIMLLGI